MKKNNFDIAKDISDKFLPTDIFAVYLNADLCMTIKEVLDKKDYLSTYSSLENYLLENEDKLQLPHDWGVVAKAVYQWILDLK